MINRFIITGKETVHNLTYMLNLAFPLCVINGSRICAICWFFSTWTIFERTEGNSVHVRTDRERTKVKQCAMVQRDCGMRNC